MFEDVQSLEHSDLCPTANFFKDTSDLSGRQSFHQCLPLELVCLNFTLLPLLLFLATPFPPNLSYVSVKAWQLLLIIFTKARGKCSAFQFDVAHKQLYWLSLTEKWGWAKLLTCRIVIHLVILFVETEECSGGM